MYNWKHIEQKQLGPGRSTTRRLAMARTLQGGFCLNTLMEQCAEGYLIHMLYRITNSAPQYEDLLRQLCLWQTFVEKSMCDTDVNFPFFDSRSLDLSYVMRHGKEKLCYIARGWNGNLPQVTTPA